MPCILTRRFCRATLYGVGRVPSDTRERLDEVDPRQLRHCFTKLFQLLQRGKELERPLKFEVQFSGCGG